LWCLTLHLPRGAVLLDEGPVNRGPDDLDEETCRSKLHDESRLIQGVLMITKMMTKSSKVKITS